MNFEKKVRDWSFSLITLIFTTSLPFLLVSYLELFYFKEKYFLTQFIGEQYPAILLLIAIILALIVLNIIANLNIFSKIKVAEYEKTKIVSSKKIDKKYFKLFVLSLAIISIVYVTALGCFVAVKHYSKWHNFNDTISKIKANISEFELQQDITEKIAQDIYHSKQARYQGLYIILRNMQIKTQTHVTILAFEGSGYNTTYYDINAYTTGGCSYDGCYVPEGQAYSLLGGIAPEISDLHPEIYPENNFYAPFYEEMDILENLRSKKINEQIYLSKRNRHNIVHMHYYRFFKTKYGDFILKLVTSIPNQ